MTRHIVTVITALPILDGELVDGPEGQPFAGGGHPEPEYDMDGGRDHALPCPGCDGAGDVALSNDSDDAMPCLTCGGTGTANPSTLKGGTR